MRGADKALARAGAESVGVHPCTMRPVVTARSEDIRTILRNLS